MSSFTLPDNRHIASLNEADFVESLQKDGQVRRESFARSTVEEADQLASQSAARARSGHAAAPPRSVMNSRRLTDDLVGAREQCCGYVEAKRLSSLEVDH